MRIETLANALSSIKAQGTPSIPGGLFGEILESRLNPDYHYMVKNGLVYVASVAAANPTAFTGGAAGTPLFGLFNPANSGKDIVIFDVTVGIRTTGTAAVTLDFSHFAGVQGSIAPTGTATASRQLYSLAASGAAAVAFINTANTGAVASSLIRASVSVGLTAVTAVTNVGVYRDEVKGAIIIAPGNYYAFGASATPTAASLDASIAWAELPV